MSTFSIHTEVSTTPASLSYDPLIPWGWHAFFEASLASEFPNWREQGYQPARVLAAFQGLYRLGFAQGECLAELSGQFRHQSLNSENLPAVGDWVLLQWQPQMQHGRIQGLLPRRSVFVRREAGGKLQAQVIAANLDTLLIVSALNSDLNLRRLERYLTLAWDCGARPVIVLNKADLAENLEADLERVTEIAQGCEIVALSALHQQGLEALDPWVYAGQTVALVGSSGVGKSTLLNVLAGEQRQTTQSAREDDSKGRHTTTHRELFVLPNGALLIDTPGLREIKLWHSQAGFEQNFADLLELTGLCRFRNCSHQQESGCEVLDSLASGDLDLGRWQSYLKQQKEEAWLERRADPELQGRSKKRWKQISKANRQRYKMLENS